MRSMRGVTLIELLVVLAIAGMLAAMVIPSYRVLVQNSQLQAQRDGLVSALRYARSTALNQNVATEVCPFGSASSTACGGNWANGWIVVLNPNGTPATPATALLQSVQNTMVNGPTISSPNGVASVGFSPVGLAPTPAEFVICDSRGGSFAYSVQVQSTGFVEVGTTQGVAVWGGAISCP